MRHICDTLCLTIDLTVARRITNSLEGYAEMISLTHFSTLGLLGVALISCATCRRFLRNARSSGSRSTARRTIATGWVLAFIIGLSSIAHADGITWVTRTSAADNTWKSVTWGGPTGQELFVAVAGSGTGNRVMTSIDGITWTSRTSAADNMWSSVTWGGPAGQQLFVAVAETGTGNRVMTSPDGITWTARTSAADQPWQSVTWGGSAGQEKFVAIAQYPAGVMTSPDGISWTLQTATLAENWWQSVTWGGPAGQEKFVAVARGANPIAYGGDPTHFVMTSPDGVTWTGRLTPLDRYDEPYLLNSVAWGGPAGDKKFVAVSVDSTAAVLTSPDGITWTLQRAASNSQWRSVTWGGPTGDEKFVAVATTGSGSRVMTSPDGITWTSRTSASDSIWWSVTWGNGMFVAVSGSGTGNRVMTSGTPIVVPTTTTSSTTTTAPPTTTIAPTTTVEPKTPDAPESHTKVSTKQTLPKTGDDSSILLLIAGLCLAGGLVLASRQRIPR